MKRPQVVKKSLLILYIVLLPSPQLCHQTGPLFLCQPQLCLGPGIQQGPGENPRGPEGTREGHNVDWAAVTWTSKLSLQLQKFPLSSPNHIRKTNLVKLFKYYKLFYYLGFFSVQSYVTFLFPKSLPSQSYGGCHTEGNGEGLCSYLWVDIGPNPSTDTYGVFMSPSLCYAWQNNEDSFCSLKWILEFLVWFGFSDKAVSLVGENKKKWLGASKPEGKTRENGWMSF